MPIPKIPPVNKPLRWISDAALKKITRKYDPEVFLPKKIYHPGGKYWTHMGPKFSNRQRGDMRKNCEYLGIDPLSIGLPPKKESKHPRPLPPQGKKSVIRKAQRQARIKELMKDMPKTIEKWRREKGEEKAKQKPLLPY